MRRGRPCPQIERLAPQLPHSTDDFGSVLARGQPAQRRATGAWEYHDNLYRTAGPPKRPEFPERNS